MQWTGQVQRGQRAGILTLGMVGKLFGLATKDMKDVCVFIGFGLNPIIVAENEKELSMQMLVGGFGASFPRTMARASRCNL